MTRMPIGAPLPNPFPAGTWNELVGVLERLQDFDPTDAVTANQLNAAIAGVAAHGVLPLLVENDTGGDLAEFAPAEIEQPSFTYPAIGGSSDNTADASLLAPQSVRLKAATASTPLEKLVITLAPIASGEPGYVGCVGIVPARVDVQDTADTTCAPDNTEATRFKSGDGALPIVWKPAATGEAWCLVKLGGPAPPERHDVAFHVTKSVPGEGVAGLTDLPSDGVFIYRRDAQALDPHEEKGLAGWESKGGRNVTSGKALRGVGYELDGALYATAIDCDTLDYDYTPPE